MMVTFTESPCFSIDIENAQEFKIGDSEKFYITRAGMAMFVKVQKK